NRHQPTFDELMEILPEGEQFVGTRGGGMDHAASLASREGRASLIGFDPLSVRLIPVPEDWAFLVAHSLTVAEKAGAARQQYNSRRVASTTALRHLGFASYREAIGAGEPEALAATLQSADEQASFLHVTTEALRVRSAVTALEQRDAAAFGP